MFDGKDATITAPSLEGTRMLHGEWIVTLTSNSSPPLCIFVYRSLKDHAGIGPVKMPIKSDMTADAAFGGAYDVLINSAVNYNASISERYWSNFLTGSI
jgi:hypothetical protein